MYKAYYPSEEVKKKLFADQVKKLFSNSCHEYRLLINLPGYKKCVTVHERINFRAKNLWWVRTLFRISLLVVKRELE